MIKLGVTNRNGNMNLDFLLNFLCCFLTMSFKYVDGHTDFKILKYIKNIFEVLI